MFFRREHLQKHIVLHTGARDFSCDMCGKEFPRKDALQDHIRRIHGPEPSNVVQFTCRLCNKGFLSKSNLRRHLDTIHLDQVSTSSNGFGQNTNKKIGTSVNENGGMAVPRNSQGRSSSGSTLPPLPALYRINTMNMNNMGFPSTSLPPAFGSRNGIFDNFGV